MQRKKGDGSFFAFIAFYIPPYLKGYFTHPMIANLYLPAHEHQLHTLPNKNPEFATGSELSREGFCFSR